MKQVRQRDKGSANITEFGATLWLLMGCIVLPLLNLAVVPLRFGLGKSIVANEVRHLAQCETFSEARKGVSTESAAITALKNIGGIEVKSMHLSLYAQSERDKTKVHSIDEPHKMPPTWLPNGMESPCLYLLDLKLDVCIYPLISSPYPHFRIPGLSGPIPIQFHEVSSWENLGCDPVTGEYCLNQ